MPAVISTSATSRKFLAQSQVNPFSDAVFNIASSMISQSQGSSVTTWSDITGNYNLTPTTDAPLYYSSGGVDSQPFVCIPENTTLQAGLHNTSFPWDLRSASIFMVIDCKTTGYPKYLFMFGNNDLIIGFNDGKLEVYNGATFSWRDTGVKMPTNRKFSLLLVSDATSTRVYVDSESNMFTLTAASAGTGTGITIPGQNAVMSNWYRLACWNRVLTGGEISNLFNYASTTYNTGNLTSTPTGYVAFDGDSTVYGTSSTRGRSWATFLAPSSNYWSYNCAYPGQTISNANSLRYPNVVAGSNNWLIINIGVNDLNSGASAATTEANLATYLAAAITAGFSKSKIIVLTLTTANPMDGKRDAYNTLLRANYTNYAGQLADIAADSVVGVITPNGGLQDAAQMDGSTHWNDTGAANVAAFIRANTTVPF